MDRLMQPTNEEQSLFAVDVIQLIRAYHTYWGLYQRSRQYSPRVQEGRLPYTPWNMVSTDDESHMYPYSLMYPSLPIRRLFTPLRFSADRRVE